MSITRMLRSIAMNRDLDLLQRWREGDRAAGQQLVRAHYHSIFHRVAQAVKDDDLAADITQQIFEIAVTKREDIVQDFNRYLHGITRFTLWRHYRSKRGAMDPSVSTLEDPSHGLSSVLTTQEDARLLVKALVSLSVEEQVYLLWAYVDQLTQGEIAERVGLTAPQINGRIHRAKGKLHERMAAMARSNDQRESLTKGFETWMGSLRRKTSEDDEEKPSS